MPSSDGACSQHLVCRRRALVGSRSRSNLPWVSPWIWATSATSTGLKRASWSASKTRDAAGPAGRLRSWAPLSPPSPSVATHSRHCPSRSLSPATRRSKRALVAASSGRLHGACCTRCAMRLTGRTLPATPSCRASARHRFLAHPRFPSPPTKVPGAMRRPSKRQSRANPWRRRSRRAVRRSNSTRRGSLTTPPVAPPSITPSFSSVSVPTSRARPPTIGGSRTRGARRGARRASCSSHAARTSAGSRRRPRGR